MTSVFTKVSTEEIHVKKLLLATLLSAPAIALAQWNVPPESARCPSKWGAGDERGSGNHMKNPKNGLRGAALIKSAKVTDLSPLLAPAIPSFPPPTSTIKPQP